MSNCISSRVYEQSGQILKRVQSEIVLFKNGKAELLPVCYLSTTAPKSGSFQGAASLGTAPKEKWAL